MKTQSDGEAVRYRSRNIGKWLDRGSSTALVLLTATAVAALQVGCDLEPSAIGTFTVEPTTVCEGEALTIRWEATGPVTLSADPPSNAAFSDSGAQPASGSMTATAQNDDVTIMISSGSASDSADVTVLSTGELHRITALGTCSGATPTWHVSYPNADWGDAVRVGQVISEESGQITVTHEGRTVSLPFGSGGTAEFDGTHFQGDWDFSMAVEPNPCGAVAGGAVPAITIQVYAVCAP